MYAPVQHIIITMTTGSLQNCSRKSPDINKILQFKIIVAKNNRKKYFKLKAVKVEHVTTTYSLFNYSELKLLEMLTDTIEL